MICPRWVAGQGLELHTPGGGGAAVTPWDSPGHWQWLSAQGQLWGKPGTECRARAE